MQILTKNYMPYDIYERHKKVASYIKVDDSVLDVGGELNHLAQFISPEKIIVANLTEGDIIIGKNKLPFESKEFSVVCAIDVLEHISKEKRGNFLSELLRVSQKRVILSFPIGTERHIKYEVEIQDWLKEHNLNVDYLKEHLKFGLPTLEQIKNLTKNLKVQFYFSGNLFINKYLFKLHITNPNIRFLRRAIYLLKLLTYFLTNPILYTLLSQRKFSQNVVRVYVIIDKK